MDTRESAWTLWENLSLVKRTMCQNEFTMKEIHWLGVTGEREDGKLLYTDFFFLCCCGQTFMSFENTTNNKSEKALEHIVNDTTGAKHNCARL